MMDLPSKVWWANEIRVWGTLATAAIGAVSFAATWAHSRWQADLNAVKEEIAAKERVESDERIAQAKARGDEAHAQAEGASAQAATARLEQEKIRAENLQLSISLERERSERLKLEGKLASRKLTSEQRDAIIKALILDRGPIIITTLGDQEAAQYGSDILSALIDAEVPLTRNSIGMMAPPRYGLVITPVHDTYLSKALDAAKIQYSRQVSNDSTPTILVGLKPPAL